MKISSFLTELKDAEQAGDVPAMERLIRELYDFSYHGRGWAFMTIIELFEKGKISMDTMLMAAVETAQGEICDRLDKILKILRKIEKKMEFNNEKST